MNIEKLYNMDESIEYIRVHQLDDKLMYEVNRTNPRFKPKHEFDFSQACTFTELVWECDGRSVSLEHIKSLYGDDPYGVFFDNGIIVDGISQDGRVTKALKVM